MTTLSFPFAVAVWVAFATPLAGCPTMRYGNPAAAEPG